MIRRPPRSTRVRSSAASDVYKRQYGDSPILCGGCAELHQLATTRRSRDHGTVRRPPRLVFEHKVAQNMAMDSALDAIQDTYDRFHELTGRRYDHLMTYKMEDAEVAIVVIGSAAGT